jgi:hypothetical protein
MWMDNVKMDLVEIGLSVVDWIGLAQDRDKWRALVDAVMNLIGSKSAERLSSGFSTGAISRTVQLHTVIYLFSSL